ncbi:MAG TPA: hypothetical protein VN688_27945 [Gemmataceae bacterium]|nr:hypothetical protein [Gemmataceae bacterium]
MFRIKDRLFIVDSALLFAEIRELSEARAMWGPRNEGIAWFLEVKTKENKTGENDGWEPCAECICPFPRVPWQEIEGQVLEWRDSWDEGMANERSTMYLFEHGSIKNCRLEFAERREAEFSLLWQGLCDLFWDEDYSDNLDFQIEARVQFIGIAVYEKEPSTSQQMLSRFQNLSDFTQESIPTYAPESTTQFRPKVD